MNKYFITNLQNLYPVNCKDWVKKNDILFTLAKKNNLCVGGSIGMTITCKKAKKEPGDLDFFTDNHSDVINFISDVMKFLAKKKGTYYKLFCNNETKFLLNDVSNFYKIKGIPFWKSICVMVLKKPIRYFYFHSMRIQKFDDIIKSAKEAELKDDKPRTSNYHPYNNEEEILEEYDWLEPVTQNSFFS